MACVLNNEQRMYIIKVRTDDDFIVSVRLNSGINSISERQLEILKTSQVFKGLEDRGVMVAQKSNEKEETISKTVKDMTVKTEKAVAKRTKKVAK